MKRYFYALVFILLTAILILAGCAQPAAEPAPTPAPAPAPTPAPTPAPAPAPEGQFDPVAVEKWVIPCTTYLTGIYASFGQELKWVNELAAEDINSSGGIRGVPLELAFFEEGSVDPPKALMAMAQLLDLDPLIILGFHSGPSVRATQPTLNDMGIPAINHVCGADVSKLFRPWAISIIPGDNILAMGAVQGWLEEVPGMNKIVQFRSPDNELWDTLGEAQADACRLNGIEVVDIDVPSGTVNLGPIAVRALGEEPDGMMFTCGPTEIAKIMIELHNRGRTDNSHNLLFECAPSPELWEIGEGYLDGCWVWVFYNVDNPSPIWQRNKQLWLEKTGMEPTFHTSGGYDEVIVLKECFEALGITGDPDKRVEERLAIRNWLANCTFEGSFGESIIVDGIKRDPAWLFVVEDNQLGETSVLCRPWETPGQ